MAFRWQTDGGPFIVIFGSSIPSSIIKKVIKSGPPLTKLSGSAHGGLAWIISILGYKSKIRIAELIYMSQVIIKVKTN